MEDLVVTLRTNDLGGLTGDSTRQLGDVLRGLRGYACIHPGLSGGLPLVTQGLSIVQASSTQSVYGESP